MKTNFKKIYKIAQMLYDNPDFHTPNESDNKTSNKILWSQLRKDFILKFLTDGAYNTKKLTNGNGLFKPKTQYNTSYKCEFRLSKKDRIFIYEVNQNMLLYCVEEYILTDKDILTYEINIDFLKKLKQFGIGKNDVIIKEKKKS